MRVPLARWRERYAKAYKMPVTAAYAARIPTSTTVTAVKEMTKATSNAPKFGLLSCKFRTERSETVLRDPENAVHHFTRVDASC